MPVLFTFLFKVNIALVLFCLGYYAVLRHLTFYTLNRIYLVTAILFASAYPFININDFIQSHQKLTGPVQYVLRWKTPAENLVKPLNQPNYWQWAEVIFWAGAMLLALRLMMQLFSLYKLYRSSSPGRMHNYPVRLVDGDISPFSFWRSIYVNPNKLSPGDLEKVLEHEQVHVSEWHTLDILLAELSTVFYWFNPGIWLMKKAIRENIEFITDRKLLQKGVDSKQYQYSLLSVSMAGASNTLVNNFNMSTIKKRIIMMNTKRSSRISLGRYMFVAPAVILLLLVFSISKADIAKKGLHTLHNLTAAITHINLLSSDKPVTIAAQPAKVATTPTKARISLKNSDTIYAGKSKDNKKSFLVTSDKGRDSIGYVLNGAKVTRTEADAVDPAKVISVEVISAEEAKKYVDFTLDKPEILFITTDDSDKGKSLKGRMDKDLRANIAGSYSKGGDQSVNMVYSVAGSGDVAPNVSSTGSGRSYSYSSTSVSSDNAPDVVIVEGKPKKLTTVNIVGAPKAQLSYNVSSDITIDPKPEVITIDSNGVKQTKYITKPWKTVRLNKINANNDELTLDNPQPLFVINGKVAKNIKNLSPEDIQSVTVLKDGTATNKYGDKGKNGVVEITTKKDK
jgi:bla regulator protein blaR1